jgi:hypothetical protein
VNNDTASTDGRTFEFYANAPWGFALDCPALQDYPFNDPF